MKLEKVLRNARNVLIGVGLSGAVLLGAASGCGTFLYSTVQGAGEETGREIVREVVREKEEKKQEQVQQKQIRGLRTYVFACNYFKDFNNNGVGDYPNEFVGIKNRFRDDEKILLVPYDEKSKKGQVAKWEIYNPSGELINTSQAICLYNNGNVWRVGENFDMTGWLIQMGGYGNYKFIYYLDGKYVDSTEFEIAKW